MPNERFMRQMLSAAPEWCAAVNNKILVANFTSVQQRMMICSACFTVSADAVGISAEVSPIELLILKRTEIYKGADAATARMIIMERWQTKWEQSSKGRYTSRLILNIQVCSVRLYIETTDVSEHTCINWTWQRLRSLRCRVWRRADPVWISSMERWASRKSADYERLFNIRQYDGELY